jgi:minor histocompatibility antigen H13
VEFTKSQVVASIPGFFFCIWYAAKKHWLANNVLGISFCIQVCFCVILRYKVNMHY